MAFEIPGFSFTLVAGADLSASLFRLVDVDANVKAVLPDAGGRVVGVLNNRPKLNEPATIVHGGIAQVEAGAAVSAGDDVMADATGRAITHTGAATKVGVAFEAASAAGIIIAVLLDSSVPTAA